MHRLALAGAPGLGRLFGVAADPTHVFAVGAAGTILAWNGSAWSTQTSGVNVTLNGVWGSDVNNIWAVGDRPAAGMNATILKSTNGGVQWTAQNSNVLNQNLMGVAGSDAMHVWAVGTVGYSSGSDGQLLALHWDGAAWSRVALS